MRDINSIFIRITFLPERKGRLWTDSREEMTEVKAVGSLKGLRILT